jgi:hypothetical protein
MQLQRPAGAWAAIWGQDSRSPWTWVLTLIVAAGATIAGIAAALAAILPLDPEAPRNRPEEAAQAYYDYLLEHAPGAVQPIVDRRLLEAQPPTCRAEAPKVLAVLIGASKPAAPFGWLQGPDNDIALLAASLKARGVDDQNLFSLTGDAATRAAVAATFAGLLQKVNCRDHVVLHFSGNAATAVTLLEALLPQRLRDEYSDVSIQEKWNADFENGDHVPTQAMRRAEHSDLFLALNSETDNIMDLLSVPDLSDFIAALRNRQADVTVMLDTSYAASANFGARQQQAGDSAFWAIETSGGEDEPEPHAYLPPLHILPAHGGFAAFYSSVGNSHSVELGFDNADGSKTAYGIFTFRLANVIQNRDSVTVRSLAESLKTLPNAEGSQQQRYRVEASDPELVMFADGSRQAPKTDPIVITKPAPKRGAAAIERAEVEIEGELNWSSPVKAVLVDGKIAELIERNGFRHTAALKPGLNTVDVVALTADGRTHEKRLEFLFEGDRKALEGEGKRYAVIIANETYDRARTGFDALKTPFEDADAVAAILTGKFGFVTEATLPDGKTLPLMVRDASRRDIETLLYWIGLVAGEKDTVLIYFAGHGIFEEKTTIAFWVPSDAEAGVPITYLSASTIAEAVQRMQANKVVIISDSCFSGALLRGGGEAAPKIGDAERERALLRLSQRRTRILISSGNNEPVEDLGGQGHSVFARALLTGLEDMQHDAFSARELFDGYILPLVIANADQEPQYRPIERSGHEGGDIVFVRQGG